MDAGQILKKLAALGTARNREVFARHGVRGALFGVDYASLGKLARELRGRHELALELWASANHDARVLATMIADPPRLGARELARWVETLDNYVVTDAFAKLAARCPAGPRLALQWLADGREWVSTAGWSTLCFSLRAGAELDEATLRGHLPTIERRIHEAKSHYARSSARIALAASERIGPDASQVTRKVLGHRGKKRTARKTRVAKH